ncbi:MAG: nucleotidyltransferase domain-containing protein [Actinomycetota bacterium]
MTALFERLANLVEVWRAGGYPCQDHPAIAEILDWAGETEEGELRFLRRPQLRALETYWYLRLIEGTPHVFDLYLRSFPPEGEKQGLLDALGVPARAFAEANYELDELWALVRDEGEFVRRHRLESLRETLTLDYPSYILALAMGAGKTVLIGAVFATEFAMALEYPDGPFVQNALVFAPGKTIIESLRELTQVPYERILPPRLHKPFAASLKLTFTRNGEKDVPVVRRSRFNVVVTNTEKIRIQKETIRKADLGRLFGDGTLDEAKAEVANLRLQAIASLPHLAVFSDEAHHTYGQSLESGLKKVRKTVDYLAQNTNVVCVVNTTGTPYHRRQPLKDVVIWYGLSQGIRENILKDLAGNILGYDLDGNAEAFVSQVIRDFFAGYRDVTLPNGAPAKIAMYFPQTDDLKELRPTVDRTLLDLGVDPSTALVNTNESTVDEIEAFNRLNDPAALHRVILLVNKGTEGWNCPSLFACALARRLKTSNNFVLQASSRCLRQVPGNDVPARVYLSMENHSILDRQLTETYGETIEDLQHATVERVRRRLELKKTDLPPLRLTQRRRRVVRRDDDLEPIALTKPATRSRRVRRRTFTMAEYRTTRRVLRDVGDTLEIEVEPDTIDGYAAAVDLAGRYRVDLWQVHDELRRLYGDGDVPLSNMPDLAEQIEEQTRAYEHLDEEVEVALALVKRDGFRAERSVDGGTVYTAEIVYPKSKEHLLVPADRLDAQNPARFGFHYDPYNFDSQPEEVLFEDVLAWANLNPDDVDDVLFTGAITDPAKTDFAVEYRDTDGKWRRYTPDFVIRRKDGRVMIIEVKGENMRDDPVNGENGRKAMAVREWADLNPQTLAYEIVFAKTDRPSPDEVAGIRAFVGAPDGGDGLRIQVDRDKIEAFCKKWRITELAFFGSVLRDDFRPDSDVDVLYTFADDANWGWEIVDAEEELAALIGRRVDLVPRKAIEQSDNYIRRKHILEHLQVYYVA